MPSVDIRPGRPAGFRFTDPIAGGACRFRPARARQDRRTRGPFARTQRRTSPTCDLLQVLVGTVSADAEQSVVALSLRPGLVGRVAASRLDDTPDERRIGGPPLVGIRWLVARHIRPGVRPRGPLRTLPATSGRDSARRANRSSCGASASPWLAGNRRRLMRT